MGRALEYDYDSEAAMRNHRAWNQHLLDNPDYTASVELFKVEPSLAVELGFEPPTCERCGGTLTNVPHDWDGVTALVHWIPKACDWEREKHEAAS